MTDVPWWATDDPWALSPEEIARLAEWRRKCEAALEAMPDPPF